MMKKECIFIPGCLRVGTIKPCLSIQGNGLIF